MKIWIFSYYDKKELEGRTGSVAEIDKNNPDFVITYGGDGTILDAELEYPGIPKIPIKKTKICGKCLVFDTNNIDLILEKLKTKDYKIREECKVEAEFQGKILIGLNEIQVRNKLPNKALRFSVNDNEEIIGDGIIVSTPYGSTAYYNVIGYEPFKEGIRLGFNNTTKKMNYIELKDNLKITIIRENGLLLADNNTEMVELKSGDVVSIKKSKKVAKFVELNL